MVECHLDAGIGRGQARRCLGWKWPPKLKDAEGLEVDAGGRAQMVDSHARRAWEWSGRDQSPCQKREGRASLCARA
eukprot:8284348-Alexandrium_andersonii.AAC.2